MSRSHGVEPTHVSVGREKVHFVSGDTECAGWHYPGTNGACVIMAGGFAVTMEPGTDLFAKRFNAAGFTVLAFDYRHLGDSGGQPRQIVGIREQLADWQAAIAFAPTLRGVDPTRIAIWGFSVSGGHVLRVAARNPELAAAIAQTPTADGPAAARNATRHQRPLASLRFIGRAVLDALGSLVGRPPLLIPLTGEPGTVALLTTPDALDGDTSAQSGQQVPGLAAGGRRSLGTSGVLLPAGPLRIPRAVPAAGARLRPGSVRTRHTRRPRRQASVSRRARPDVRRALRALPRRPRPGRRSRAVVPASTPARPVAATLRPRVPPAADARPPGQ